MTQITIAQWLATNTQQSEVNMTAPRYQLVHSKKFYGKYDILDTHTGIREPVGTTNVRMLKLEVSRLNSQSLVK